MSESAKKALALIAFEIEQIDQLLSVYAELLERAQHQSPDAVEKAALGTVLHSFYNGLESIFLAVAKKIDRQVPTGPQWHRDLLEQMTRSTAARSPVISEELAQKLLDYMGFRHIFRHTYSFYLEWSGLKKLVIPLEEIWAETKGELNKFKETFPCPPNTSNP